MDSTLQKINILQKCFLDDLDCYNFRKYLGQRNAVYRTEHETASLAKFNLTTTELDTNTVKFENTITDYVQKHMFEKLQEGNYNLFLSGGIDSENIAKILIQSKIKFTPVIVSYFHKDKVLNDYDINYAYKFCKQENLKPLVIDIDIVDFFSSGKFRKYSLENKCESPQFCPILHAFEKIDGNIIYSGHQKIYTNFLYSARTNSQSLEQVINNYQFNGDPRNDINFMEKGHTFFVFDEVLNRRNDDSISDFYSHNIGMSLSATNNFITNTSVTYDELLAYNEWKIKDNLLLYQDDWQVSETGQYRNNKLARYKFKVKNFYKPNNLDAEPRPKYTGFEGLKKFFSDKYIGKDLLLKQFDKYFREPMVNAADPINEHTGMIVNYILRKN